MAKNSAISKQSNNTKDSYPILPEYRYLALDGNEGTVYCRVYGHQQNTPWLSFSKNWRLEFSTRSFLRMSNLAVFRGNTPKNAMIGPCESYGNLEKPHEKAFSIKIQDSFPSFHEHSTASDIKAYNTNKRAILPDEYISLRAHWYSGKDKHAINKKRKEYKEANANGALFGGSLFPDSGLLEIDGKMSYNLPTFDATQVDLSSFKARLVRNDQPFRIVTTPLPASDEYRPVSYQFGKEYAKHCVSKGGGLFLETHDFTQTMTPLDQSAGGFITLGRWSSKNQKTLSGTLDLIAVKIPYGYTLLVDKDCIHGDSTFTGKYMMSMTSNHITMQSANTVFLKNKHNKQNISLKSKHVESVVDTAKSNPPLALFGFTKEAWFGNSSPKKGLPESIKQSEIDFKRETASKHKLNFIWQPLSKNFWRQLRLKSNIPIDLTKRKVYAQIVSNGAIIGATLGAFCLYFGFSIGLLSAMVGLYMGALLGKYRYQYLNYATNQKSALVKNKKTTQETSEQKAFKAGIDAKNWRGYYTSYVNFSTYKHPLAFAAGLKTGMDKEIELSTKRTNRKSQI